jgi:hypothetical protein
MAQWWELDSASKRGVFNFRPHRDTYILLANYSSSSNDAPFEDFTPAGIKAKHVELMYQLSFKMKLIEQPRRRPSICGSATPRRASGKPITGLPPVRFAKPITSPS